jgi:hypothetical protein
MKGGRYVWPAMLWHGAPAPDVATARPYYAEALSAALGMRPLVAHARQGLALLA